MPIYEYVCQDCDTHFEVVRPIKDADAPITCKTCHSSEHIKRMISVFFAQSSGQTISGGSSCSSCSGGSCASCHH